VTRNGAKGERTDRSSEGNASHHRVWIASRSSRLLHMPERRDESVSCYFEFSKGGVTRGISGRDELVFTIFPEVFVPITDEL
jgi:hypothetical protein